MKVNKSEIRNMSRGLLLPGILSLLIGIIAIAFPMETDKLTIVMIGVFVGIKLIFDGIAFILTATAARKQQKL